MRGGYNEAALVLEVCRPGHAIIAGASAASSSTLDLPRVLAPPLPPWKPYSTSVPSPPQHCPLPSRQPNYFAEYCWPGDRVNER